VVCEWLRSLLGLPEATEGVLLSGGSMANITGLVAVRTVLGDRVVYLSDQTHSSIERGLRVLGLPGEYLRVLPSDERLRLPLDGLRSAIAEDRAAGRPP
jgi:aromatic-L-amino-acid/L-tryptophan decarboxylase